jgi:hypothetical protein
MTRATDPIRQTRPHAPLRRRAGFLRDERGTVTIFALMMFVLMLAAGGIAIDVMRYETQRTQLQYTLDRAVLAAAALNQTEDPEAVVIDYFATSGLDHYRLEVDVDEGLNFRRVSAYAEMDLRSYFMNMFGVNALTSPARGAAEERIMDIEISMVLDISGSMGWNNKIRNMRDAANEFIDTVLAANEEEDQVSISIIPYHSQVNAGTTLASVFTLSDEHSESNCTRFDPADYNVTAIDPDEAIERIAHFDYRNRSSYRTFRTPHCTTSDYAAILPWSNDADELHALVNSLSANGNTAIDLGMRWAVGLLDPAAQPAVTELIAAGEVDEDFEGRPYSYEEDEVLKIIILMTDGENTSQVDVVQEFKRGPSTVFRDPDTGRTSAYLPRYDLYYWHHNDSYNSQPYGGSDAEAIPWAELWATYSARMLAGEYYYYAGDWDYYRQLRYYSIETYAGANEADANLRNICDAANDAGIIVFTIAFEAPARGESVMQHCASTPAHYYDAEGIEISEAFASIAASINQLKLIQ